MSEVERYRWPEAWGDEEISRYWVHPQIMVGGSLRNEADWLKLSQRFNLNAVINVESEHRDAGKVDPLYLLEFDDVQGDDGSPRKREHIFAAIDFASFLLPHNLKIYVHCQKGMARSPAFAYAIMRANLKMGREACVNAIRGAIPRSPAFATPDTRTLNYVEGIEAVLR